MVKFLAHAHVQGGCHLPFALNSAGEKPKKGLPGNGDRLLHQANVLSQICY